MIRRFTKEHSSALFSVGAGMGVITTAYLAAKAGYQTAQAMTYVEPDLELKEKARRVWRLYIPAGTSAAVTIICVAGAKRIDGRKTLAAQAALAVSQRAYEAYREEVVEELGERKDKIFASRIAQKQVNNNPPTIITNVEGRVLCCELFTGRYFHSDMEALTKAVNQINSEIVRHDYATLDDLYYILGLENTTASANMGWRVSRLLELEFSTILYKDQPCLAFDYNYIKSL